LKTSKTIGGRNCWNIDIPSSDRACHGSEQKKFQPPAETFPFTQHNTSDDEALANQRLAGKIRIPFKNFMPNVNGTKVTVSSQILDASSLYIIITTLA
jgi:hypothetical protein